MANEFNKLNLFFEKIKTITFWQRIFSWKDVRSLSYEAYEEFKTLITLLNQNLAELDGTKNSLNLLKNDNEHIKQNHSAIEINYTQLEEKYNSLTKDFQLLKAGFASQTQNLKNVEDLSNQQKQTISVMEEKVRNLENQNRTLEKSNNQFLQTEEDRKIKYETDVANLNKIRQQIQDDRNIEIKNQQQEEIEELKSMKETWANHQSTVQSTIKVICQKHTIEYVDKVPFKGSPDNTIKVCDEYVIFDAKSPASDDLQNFPNYIKTQTEGLTKYIKQENVKKDVFLVIPSNTVPVIKQFCYNMADYNVYIVTLDSLEPIIMCLKRIEDYEFLEQLSPEERENICRIIGKFAHITKRRIQIDHFFAGEFFEILTKCGTEIPRDMLGKIIEFEKAEKLNPPIERRAKQIPIADLLSDSEKIEREANAKGIAFPSTTHDVIKKLPLYNDEQEKGQL